MSPRRWACPASALTVGSPVTTPKATPDSRTARRDPHDPDPHQPRGRRACAGRAPRAPPRTGPAGPELGVPARTVSRILRRHDVPRLCDCDPLTGELIRSSKTTAVRYERDRPGELVHMDVKKLGRIPDGGGWRAHGRRCGITRQKNDQRVGYDYVHSVVDDHSRARLLRDPRRRERRHRRRVLRTRHRASSPTTASASNGHDRQPLELPPRHALRDLLAAARHQPQVHPPHCPWQNGKVERFNRTLANRMGLPAGLHQQRPTPAALPASSTTTTTDGDTPPSAATHPSAACHQPEAGYT